MSGSLHRVVRGSPVKGGAAAVRTYGPKGGFTLIEILVVVAIIALLIAILLPSLRKARVQAQATICGTQLEQIFGGIFMYTQANAELLPHLGYRADRNRMLYAWFTQIAPHVRHQYGIYVCPTDERPEKHAVFVRKGTIRMAAATEPATTLPVTYRGSCDSLDDGKKWTIGAPGYPAAPLYPMPRKLTDFNRPGTAMLMVEGWTPGKTGDACFRFDHLTHLIEPYVKHGPDQPDSVASFGRHNGRSNVLFADGHVGRHTVWDLYNHLPYQQQFTDRLAMRRKR
jgi:prepilin-type processing-associated H-X9-DG protein/prepilin-type N-terminal cleavage/methylation domain-containing protein